MASDEQSAAAHGGADAVSVWLRERNRILGNRWFSDMEPLEARDAFERLSAAFRTHLTSRPEVGNVVERTLPLPSGPVGVRVYTPRAAGRAPVIVYFHGGGFVFGSVDSFDEVARLTCETCRVVVVSVDYPLAPEHRFPGPFRTCVESVEWVKRNAASLGGDPGNVLVMGDSAGGNLAAATALECAARDVRLKGQVILYGTLAHVGLTADAGVLAWDRRDQRFGPTLAATTWYWTNYTQSVDAARDPRASVLLEKDMSKAPPALITAGSRDTFRVDGEAYWRSLRDSGVEAEFREFPEVAHGYIAQGWWPETERDPVSYEASMETLEKVKKMAHS